MTRRNITLRNTTRLQMGLVLHTLPCQSLEETTGYQRKRKFFNALFISPAASLKLSKKNTGFQYTAIFLPTSIASLKPNAMEVRPIYLYIFSLFSYLFSKHPCVYRVIRWLPTIICLWPSNKKHF